MEYNYFIYKDYKILYNKNIDSKNINIIYILDAEPYLYNLFISCLYTYNCIKNHFNNYLIIGISFSSPIPNFNKLKPNKKYNIIKSIRKKKYIIDYKLFTIDILKIIKLIDKKYIKYIIKDKLILGFSLAGLFINKFKIDYPNIFSYYLVCSPSLAYNNFKFFKIYKNLVNIEKGHLLSYGTKESSNMQVACNYLKYKNKNIKLKIIYDYNHYNIKIIFINNVLEYLYNLNI